MSTPGSSRRRTIIRALQQMGMQAGSHEAGVPTPFVGSKIYAPPTQTQLTSEWGTPFFSVSRATLVGYTIGGDFISIDNAHGVQSTEPVWDFNIYTWHPYDENYPNYDDADDDAELLRIFAMANPTLPFGSAVAALPAPTTTVFSLKPGDGQYFAPYLDIFVNGVDVGMVQQIVGDVVTLQNAMAVQPVAGQQASQGSCYNSFPYDVMPDYAQLTQGGPWSVGRLTVRAFEGLYNPFP